MYSGIFGLYYAQEYRFVSLPLLNVQAEASIKELAAQVKLTQTYANDANVPIEASYTFPIPSRAAVCSFVMIKQDGTRVVGIVKEKQEARETYQTAVAAGHQASLLEQQTPDVFQVSVGNIASNEQVQIELIYATELAEDEESDSIRFHLPVHIGARYGHAPTSPRTFSFRNFFLKAKSSPPPFLTVALNVEAQAPIAKIGSPSHTVSTELGPDPKLPNFNELPFSNYARISLSSESMLDKDFVLTVKSAGLDAPRCVAELHPTDNTVAMALTLVPRFKLPDVSRQEFVLLVDRSGSMGGSRIEAAKKAMVVMLRAIPHKDSLFQIMSFGSHCSSLWTEGSKPYNQETLEQATQHVDSMSADFGGTEIRSALAKCFRDRKTDRPLSVLMLTDGEAWDLEGVLAECKSAVESAPKNAYIRISVLGIGDGVSTAMCEGIARIGNGTCMLVGEQESNFTGKISRMLKAAKSPPISDITVDWGQPEVIESAVVESKDDDGFEMVEEESGEKPKPKAKLNIFDDSIDDPITAESAPAPPPPPVSLPPPAYVQQAPFKIQNLFPNVRLNVYAILQDKHTPKTVILRGKTVDDAEIELPVSVTVSQLQNLPEAPPAVHALAARKIIQDLEDGRHGVAKTLKDSNDSDLLARTVKALIVRLGKTYSIVSTHTSFVAVDESDPAKKMPVFVPVEQSEKESGSVKRGGGGPLRMSKMATGGMVQRSAAMPPPPAGAMFGAAPPRPMMAAPPVMMAAPAAPSPQASSRSAAAPDLSSYNYSSVSSLVLTADRSTVSSRSAAPSFMRRKVARAAAEEETVARPPTPSDPLEALARLQAFDGCFSLDVLKVVKLAPAKDVDAVRAVLPPNSSDAVIATLLAMAFLANKLGAGVERDSWGGDVREGRGVCPGRIAGFGCV
ncbi:hypothetical protein MIND_00954900 [Mycena indigotica]|uniref:Uncharacterized protein n=1 Tax=Mycena indigotica TaxID=2126181 RepID=A0A8H6SE10_9AGAR|nr:uncharacterized protein MIND_00954900 [Mycena indigotica]KAF7297218.1 hypothetical protein MIND_00954900 [Mycena indigotica]